jgi:hypothetical protein
VDEACEEVADMREASGRRLSSGVGTAAAPGRRGLPATGTAPGAYRGAGFGQSFGATERKDNWWLMPLSQAVGLACLGAYATWAAYQGKHYEYAHYLSPFYSPLFRPSWLPPWLSPAFLILWIPLGFRATCYYYRKAYYRAFFADPAACAVGEMKSQGYCGEVAFPFVLQNLHRYFMYLAGVILIFLWIDVVRAFTFPQADGGTRLGLGLGTLVLLANTTLLSLYSLSCHSLRHLVGGKLDCFSCAAAGGPRLKTWSIVSVLNGHHMGFAWWSLFAVCFADLYVRLCSMGVVHDPVFYLSKLGDMPVKPF